MDEEKGTNISQQISIADTENSYQNNVDQEINKLIQEYDEIEFGGDNEDKEKKTQKLNDLLTRMKPFKNHDSIKDLIQELESKIKINEVYNDQEKEIQGIIKRNEEEESKRVVIEENKEEPVRKLATYNKYTDKEEEGDYPKMSVKFFNKMLSENGQLYYRTYELNDILYLHFKGFRKLENLELFKNIKVLYLEGNCIKKIEGLETLVQLTSLYLHENLIEKIEGLETLKNLYNLNLADNCITKIEGLSKLPNLCNVILSRNKIGLNGIEDLSGLTEMEPSVMVINLENNKISVDNVLEEIFMKIPQIRVIYLQGNECLRKIPSYRKNFIAKLKELRYLDDRPVFDDERRFAEAFGRGGLEEERLERALYKKEKDEADMRRLKEFQDMVDTWKGKANEDEERLKKKEEERQKLLEKCKGKLKTKETKKENLIFTDEDITNKEELNSCTPNSEIQNDQSKNAHYDDLPSLETAKNLKESGYLEYLLETTNTGSLKEEEVKESSSEVTYKEETVDTSEKKVIPQAKFDELD